MLLKKAILNKMYFFENDNIKKESTKKTLKYNQNQVVKFIREQILFFYVFVYLMLPGVRRKIEYSLFKIYVFLTFCIIFSFFKNEKCVFDNISKSLIPNFIVYSKTDVVDMHN